MKRFWYLLLITLVCLDLRIAKAANTDGKSLFLLQHIWKDQNGVSLNLKELQGHPTIVTMVFTSCPAACPTIVSEIKALDAKLTKEERGKIRYALFSFDPSRDTPSVLDAFSHKMKLDNRWRLLTSTEEQAREVAAVLGFKFKKFEDGDFTHSASFYLLSSEGALVVTKESDGDRNTFLAKMRETLSSKKK